LVAVAAVGAGCARRSSTIPGTRIADDRFNREVLAAVESYRLAVEKGDAEALFLMASEHHQFISSRFVKEIGRLGGDISHFVTPRVHAAMRAKLAGQPWGAGEPTLPPTTVPRAPL